ncbi:class I SAM-dependent methyltransferase [Macrococcus lamae]|uniref:Class I SAM-dependent methyltransferase n=1 Tax=Macrococcus lamae TaxID=198484 RepID=A0A4R6BS09_9STAP|nr:methyltransferase domain-containing protein [Macrococcus lamae]TDM05140.1 class I SAM-dependent methyltransferase [Macrococcus lamae]
MNQSDNNKKAWECRAYDFWVMRDGTPKDKVAAIIMDPLVHLKKHQDLFKDVKGKKIANICGSNGRKAVPLALLGADVTVFDISEENKKYALELAKHAGTNVNYIVTDIYDIDISKFNEMFDILYLEGGILHYFDDLSRLFNILQKILNENGILILSDYHPIKNCINENNQYLNNYFDQPVMPCNIAYKPFFSTEEQKEFLDVLLKHHTLSDILNTVIKEGFTIKQYDEHRGWNNENIPWEYTLIAVNH